MRSNPPMGIVRCADLTHIRDGRNMEVVGVILVRRRPGCQGRAVRHGRGRDAHRQRQLPARSVGIYRRQVMSASMIAMRGRVQKEGEVIHTIFNRITDHDTMLRSIAQSKVSITSGCGDGARNGGSPHSQPLLSLSFSTWSGGRMQRGYRDVSRPRRSPTERTRHRQSVALLGPPRS